MAHRGGRTLEVKVLGIIICVNSPGGGVVILEKSGHTVRAEKPQARQQT